MKHLWMLVVVAAFCACSSIRKDQIVPTPQSTPFDYSPMLRAAYLDAYQDGYRATKSGNRMRVFRQGPYDFARELGYRAGALDASNPPE